MQSELLEAIAKGLIVQNYEEGKIEEKKNLFVAKQQFKRGLEKNINEVLFCMKDGDITAYQFTCWHDLNLPGEPSKELENIFHSLPMLKEGQCYAFKESMSITIKKGTNNGEILNVSPWIMRNLIPNWEELVVA